MQSSTNHPPQAPASSNSGRVSSSSNSSKNDPSPSSKYHALIIDSGAIIKQTSLGSFSSSNSLLTSAKHYYTVPAVLSEIRDAKSRQHLEQFQLRLSSLHDTTLETRTPSKEAVAAMSEFARKTGDYSQLSGVDLQVLALLYDLEVEAAGIYNGGKLGHVRKEPKRVLGVSVKALSGDGKRLRNVKGDNDSVATSSGSSVATNGVVNNTMAFFHGNADGIIDAAHVDLEYDEEDDGDDDRIIVDAANEVVEEERQDSAIAAPPKMKSWALLVNPEKASTVPLVNYSIAAASTTSTASGSGRTDNNKTVQEPVSDKELKKETPSATAVDGQFDDASESEQEEEDDDDAFSNNTSDDDSNGELDAINIANAKSDDEIMSDEECDVFILDPHEAVYFKKLKEQQNNNGQKEMELVAQLEKQTVSSPQEVDDGGLELEFPTLAAAATVPNEGSDDEEVGATTQELLAGDTKSAEDTLAWQQEEEERKKRALQPMVNGRVVKTVNKQAAPYSSFRRYKNVVSASGSAVAMEQQKEQEVKASLELPEGGAGNDSKDSTTSKEAENNTNQGYKSRIPTAEGADFPSEMTADDDDGEGWVTSTSDIQTMKATGSLHLSPHRNPNNKKKNASSTTKPRQNYGPPMSQRAACATTDFAMQNVILQMNLELLSVDGVRVRRLKTWVTRCGACFTIYGNDDKKGSGGGSGRLFCDKCGSNTLQRIAASVDRNTGRLKLHMRKNYQYNTRGTKFSLPKAGKGNKYEGDLLLAEDQLLYGAWNQKVRKGKSKTSGQSIFGSDLASDLGCHTDLTKRDDIRVGFGRRNPNSTKFGRERRGKKKKNTGDKACGLRRY